MSEENVASQNAANIMEARGITKVSGLYPVTSGNFRFLARNVTRYKAHRRAQMGIGRTFQNIRLFDTMSAVENVLSGMHTRLKGNIMGSILGLPGTRREEREARERAA